VTIKVVFDPGLYVAAALLPGKVADYWLRLALKTDRPIEILATDRVLDEVEKKLTKFPGWDPVKISMFITWLRTEVVTIIPPTNTSPTNNPTLDCAQSGEGQFIVAIDKGLLALGAFNGIPIYSPRKMMVAFPLTDRP
jgi:predicted nucleic acid-binding protein